MTDPAPLVDSEAKRSGIGGSILIHTDESVPRANGMLGISGRADHLRHSCAFIDQCGEILRVRHNVEISEPIGRLLADLTGQHPGKGAC